MATQTATRLGKAAPARREPAPHAPGMHADARTPAVETTRRHDAPSRSIATPGWTCLLLAEDAQRREGFVRAAEASGWRSIACESIVEALRESERWRTHLAVIDLGSMPPLQKAAHMRFAAQLASQEQLLLISDEPADGAVEAELCARQLGAWLYLPSPDWSAGLPTVFSAAREVCEKLGGQPMPAC